ncbi:MAG: amylo-alpha-1,6-glucosidase [Gracilimonas sp.]
MKVLFVIIACFGFIIGSTNTEVLYAQNYDTIKDSLKVQFNGDASIEVGSPFVGLEFHHSSPLAQRISFYYPVANSIDLSNDYWTRDQNFSMMLGLKIGEDTKEWIGLEPFAYTLTPYEVNFQESDERKQVKVKYQFSKDSPVFIATYEIKNLDSETRTFEFYTDIEASLKTSHTYATKDMAWSEFRDQGSALFINFDEPETQNAQLFSVNAGLSPHAYSSLSSLDSLPAADVWWDEADWNLENQTISKENPQTPAFKYLYRKNLAPGESMKIIQIVGAAKEGEGYELAEKLPSTFQKEIKEYEEQILKTMSEKTFETGDPVLDHSVLWSHGILQANQHYIDGSIQPMPCPAQYNFYFTHDVLLTDLAAINFDLPRVKRDLEFIINHANTDYVIPHAYYWKDLGYLTEFAPPDNWNHFWFVITAGSYLRHSGDEDFAKKLYPYLEKSVEDFQQHKQDDIIYSYRPDWWDIAWNFGPRSYTTILATKALREFIFISSVIGENEQNLKEWEENANQLQKGLNEKLWSEDQQYLINYFEDGSLDSHYYIGSLLGSHYNLLDEERKKKLVDTAGDKIYDPKIGVYTVYPMDFHNLIDYLKLNGNEAGDPYYYINGGIWPHGNAWYALALMESGQNNEALSFIRNIMTVKGAMDSPNGQPAMYEYRVSKKDDPAVYGKIDKPQFTWAAGWYLYSLYNVYGVKENEWNIRFEPYLPADQEQVSFMLTAGGKDLRVDISGKGNQVQSIHFDGKQEYSTVLPYNLNQDLEKIEIRKGILSAPLVTKLNAILQHVEFDEVNHNMNIKIKSFEGHQVVAVIDTPWPVEEVSINGSSNKIDWSIAKNEDVYKLQIEFNQKYNTDELSVDFKK